MPKPFLIGVEIEEVALGAVLRRLHAMPGIVALHMDFDKPGKPASPSSDDEGRHARKNGNNGAEPPKRRGRPPGTGSKNFAGTGEDALRDILRHGTHSMSDLRGGFEAIGRSPSSVSSLLHKLIKSGDAVRAGRDAYTSKKKRAARKSA